MKLDKDHYVDNRTGEVKEFSHLKNRADDTVSVTESLARLRDYLNTNVVTPSHCRWLTLTYAENMTNPEKLKWDFKNFNARCRTVYGQYEYITAAEPQARGAWHLHVILIFAHPAPFMANDKVAALWRKGFVSIKRLDSIDNIGAYLTAYLGDMDLCEFREVFSSTAAGEFKEIDTIENGVNIKKRIIKGARLAMYPPGFHLYRCSRGIKHPIVYRSTYQEATASLSGLIPTYRHALKISDGDFENTIIHEQYNKRRKFPTKGEPPP